jgi:hypothetical protein
MRDIESDTYFLRLAFRCRKALQECFELRAQVEFRRLAEEFTANADALARTGTTTTATEPTPTRTSVSLDDVHRSPSSTRDYAGWSWWWWSLKKLT